MPHELVCRSDRARWITRKALVPASAAALALLLLSGCASLPRDLKQVPSRAWSRPQETGLGRYFADGAPTDPELSGVQLVDEPAYAFGVRFGLASMAEKTLDLQYYLWKGDLSGRLLLYRVLQAADRGVKVRILIDDIYHAGRDDVYAALDAHPDLELRVFNPFARRGKLRGVNFLTDKRRLNRRMHNKIFLADGAVAILGGRNIGDDYFGLDPDYNFRDLDVLAVGRAAPEAATAFDEYWNSGAAVPIGALRKKPSSGEALDGARRDLSKSLSGKRHLPFDLAMDAVEARRRLAELREDLIWASAEIVVDPLEKFDRVGQSAFVRLGNELRDRVEEELVIQSAYLIPGDDAVANLASMAERGVRVRMLTNSLISNNHLTAHSGYLKYRKDLLRAGVELHELRADAELRAYFRAHESDTEMHAGTHTKAFVIDGRRSLIGSFNMDPRSRDLNSEIGLIVYSPEFAAKVLEYMEIDFDPANSYRVRLTERGKLRWDLETPTGSRVFKKDPGTPVWKRAAARVLSWLPIEKEL